MLGVILIYGENLLTLILWMYNVHFNSLEGNRSHQPTKALRYYVFPILIVLLQLFVNG